jgi:hypothetical protein
MYCAAGFEQKKNKTYNNLLWQDTGMQLSKRAVYHFIYHIFAFLNS